MTYGATFSQSGTPIDRAADFQRILDTRWKTMSIVETQPFIGGLGANFTTYKILDHNLGYLPAFEAPYYNTRYEVQSTAAGTFAFVADRTSIYFVKVNGVDLPKYTMNGHINVYDLNIEEDFDSQAKGNMLSPKKTSYGIKIVGDDEYAAKNVGDAGTLGFAMTTESKALGISRVNQVIITSGGFGEDAKAIIEHDLGYPPLIKFINMNPITGGITAPSNSPVFCGPMGMSFGTNNLWVRAETNRLTVSASQASTLRYIIFREPTEIAG